MLTRFRGAQTLLAAATVAALLAPPARATAAEGSITIASYGGAYARSQVVAFVDPFREETRQWVEMVSHRGDLEELRDQVLSGNVTWDVVDMTATDAIRACNEGLLQRLEGLPLAPSTSGQPAAEDFLAGSLLPCGVGQNIWATVIAYEASAYEGLTAPSTLADFFDLERFPGSRGLQKSAQVNLEWALLADGAAPGEIYTLLESDAGLERALAVLERIRPAIVWWTRGEEALDLLQQRRVAMSSAWSGRVFFRNRVRGGSIRAIWEGNVWEREFWAVPRGAPNAETAKRFIAFATEPERQAVQANQIAYSPARASADPLVDEAVRPFLPTTPENAALGVASDADWWARNGARLEQAFQDWADGPKKRVRNSTQH